MTMMTSPISQPIRLLLIGDQPIVLSGLRLLLETTTSITVIGETSSPSEAVQIATHEQPDIIVLDLNSKDGANLECLPSLFNVADSTRVLVLIEGHQCELGQRAMRLGATGIVLKDNAPAVLIKAIQQVRTGEAWLDQLTIARALSEVSSVGYKRPESPKANGIATLTKREREVITLVAIGLRNKQVAERLFISRVTVRHHLTSVFGKLGVSDRFELMVYAHKQGLAEPLAET